MHVRYRSVPLSPIHAPYRTGSRRSMLLWSHPGIPPDVMQQAVTVCRIRRHTVAARRYILTRLRRITGVICPFPGIQLSRPLQFEFRSFPIQFHHISPSYNFKLTSERQTLFNRKNLTENCQALLLSVFSFYFNTHTAYLISVSCHKLSESCRLKSAVI